MDYELAYRYGAPSRLDEGAGLALATSGGSTPEGEAAHPYFFSGFMERPDVVAAGLLAVARVARTRFYVPPGMVVAPGGGLTRIGMLDPVVTSTAEGLRFESFSVCCGVYARLDVESSALDATHRAVGVTNVDVNQPLRAALASLRAGEPLHLGVGEEGLTATTLDEEVTEEKVPLSLRWLKGFAETQMLSSAMMPLHALNTAQARAFIRGLPRSSATGTVMWAGRAVRGLRLGTRPAPGAACVAGPERLRVFEPLLHLITSLEAYGPDVDAGSEPVASLWVARLPGARLSVGLSPAKSRGFSGEGAVLASLGDRGGRGHAVRPALLRAAHRHAAHGHPLRTGPRPGGRRPGTPGLERAGWLRRHRGHLLSPSSARASRRPHRYASAPGRGAHAH